MMRRSFIFTLVAILSLGAVNLSPTAQQVKPAPQSSCSSERLRAETAETFLEAERLKADACTKSLSRERATHAGQLGAEQRNAASSRDLAASLATSYAGSQKQVKELQGSIAEQKALIAKVTAERDAARDADALKAKKIKAANGTFACEIFHLGCIK